MAQRTLIPAITLLFAFFAVTGCGRSKPVGVTTDGAAGTGGSTDGGTLTSKLVKAIALPGMPTVSTYNSGTKKAYFACQTTANVSVGVAVVDDATNAVVSTIMLTGPVTGLAANATTKLVYASEGDQVDVIDSATDKVTTTVKTPDGALISGVTVDETHNLVYAVAVVTNTTNLYVLDGATNMMRIVRQVLLYPSGAPPIAVDEAMQLVFVLGADSNGAGEMVAIDGVSGTPQKLSTSDSIVSASASGVVALGNGQAAALLLGPNILEGLYRPDIKLADGFTPTGIAAAGVHGGRNIIVVGFGADGGSQILVFDAVTGLPSSSALALGSGAAATTVAAGVLAAEPIAGGTELYVDEEDPKSNPPSGPPETLKIELTTAP
jgi:hypothetical protein